MESEKEIIKVAEAYLQDPSLKQIASNLANAWDVSNPETLEHVKDLAYWTYIYGNSDLALQIGKLISEMPFEGNFNLWDWIQYVLVLQARIYREAGDTENAGDRIHKIHGVAYQLDDFKAKLLKKTFARRLSGSLLYDDKIQEAINKGDKGQEIRRRYLQVNELCFIREMGGSDNLPTQIVEQMMQENLQIIRDWQV